MSRLALFPLSGGCAPCSGIIQVNLTAGTYIKTQDFYTLGQFSKFVARDAVYLNSTGSWDYPYGRRNV